MYLHQAFFLAEGLEVFVVFAQQCGGIQLVGATGGAGTAVDAILDLLHLFDPLGGGVLLPGSAAQHEDHTGGVGDVNAGGASRLAVAAATAEVAGQVHFILVDDGLQVFGEGHTLFGIGQKLGQFLGLLHAPDGHQIVILGEVTQTEKDKYMILLTCGI